MNDLPSFTTTYLPKRRYGSCRTNHLNESYNELQGEYLRVCASRIDSALVFLAPKFGSPAEARFLALFLGVLDQHSGSYADAEGMPFCSGWHTERVQLDTMCTMNVVVFGTAFRNTRYKWYMAIQPELVIEGKRIRPDFFAQLHKATKPGCIGDPVMRVAVEVDGFRYHSDQSAISKDHQRDRMFGLLNIIPFRIAATEMEPSNVGAVVPAVIQLLDFLLLAPYRIHDPLNPPVMVLSSGKTA